MIQKVRPKLLFAFAMVAILCSCSGIGSGNSAQNQPIAACQSGKPYTRWWWFASTFTNKDIRQQLIWLKNNNFGGVEIAFIYPVNRNPEAERFEWLGQEWQQRVVYAKTCADSLAMGCDFTFGTLWPFGGTFVSDADRTKRWGDSSFKQPLRLSWTHPDTGNVLDHLNKEAFDRYAAVMGEALAPATRGAQSALFCDSWEVETKFLWTDGFEKKFEEKFGYDITPFMNSIYADYNAGPRYDYMKLVAGMVLNNFYIPFSQKCHEMNALSRVQCSGSPTDIIRAYASVDIPETEAMLYEPNFSRIVASAAALANKPLVSSETFTCLYGWPAAHIREEQTADLKMVADALFANGVNQIIWHGTPFNPVGVDTIYFYASVHVGSKGSLIGELPEFNKYMTKVTEAMRFGEVYTDIAVYLPLEDAWIAGELPLEMQLPWAWGYYEMRYEYLPEELRGYQPLWTNADFLQQGFMADNKLYINGKVFKALYVDALYLDLESLTVIHALAQQGLPVVLKNSPLEAGNTKHKEFGHFIQSLGKMKNVDEDLLQLIDFKPLVEGENLPEFWCRTDGKSAQIFFANPASTGLKYPLEYGQSLTGSTAVVPVVINFNNHIIPLDLKFEPYQSLLLKIDRMGKIDFADITFIPETPVKISPK